jgi:hypothetical protein
MFNLFIAQKKTVKSLLSVATFLLFSFSCKNPTTIKNEQTAIARHKFEITKQDILKNFKQVQESSLYTTPTISDYFNYAIWNNKEIDSQISHFLKVLSSKESIFYEDPQIQFMFLPIYSSFKTAGPPIRQFSVAQKFPTTSKLGVEQKSIYHEAAAAYYQIQEQLIYLQEEIIKNLIVWKKLTKILNIKKKKVQILKNIQKFLASGIAFQKKENYFFKEIVDLKIRINQTKQEITTIKSNIRSVKNTLGNLLYINKYENLQLPDLKPLGKIARSNISKNFFSNPILKRYKELIYKTDVEVQRNAKNFIPDFSVELGFTFKSMDPVSSFMGKKGILSSLMANLPIYTQKLKAIVISSIFENFTMQYQYNIVERKLLTDFIANQIEIILNNKLIRLVKLQISQVQKLKSYLNNLISSGSTDYSSLAMLNLTLLDYKEIIIENYYQRLANKLSNRFLIGKLILGETK